MRTKFLRTTLLPCLALLLWTGAAGAALPATVVWECRTTGSDSNGGGFVAGGTGTDFSVQNAAQYTKTDLVVDATTNTKVTSAGHNFVAADVDNIMQITAGTGWTVGFYRIVSVASNAATLDRSPALVGVTGGTYAVGGALLSPSIVASGMVAGNVGWIRSGTYTIASASTNVGGSCISLPAGVTATATKLIGYGTTRGDNGTRPLLQANGISTFTIIQLAANNRLENLSLDGATLTSSRGVATSTFSTTCFRCKFANCTNSGYSGNSASTAILCEATGCTTAGNGLSSGQFFFCTAYSNTVAGFNVPANASAVGCVSINNTGASSDGFAASNTSNLTNCLAYGNGRDGFRVGASNGTTNFLSCLADSNTGTGFNASGADDGTYMHNCATRANGTAISTNIPAANQFGTVSLTSSPFINAAGNNFELNRTAGGGAACRIAGIPSQSGAYVLPGLSTASWVDIGPSQGKWIPRR